MTESIGWEVVLQTPRPTLVEAAVEILGKAGLTCRVVADESTWRLSDLHSRDWLVQVSGRDQVLARRLVARRAMDEMATRIAAEGRSLPLAAGPQGVVFTPPGPAAAPSPIPATGPPAHTSPRSPVPAHSASVSLGPSPDLSSPPPERLPVAAPSVPPEPSGSPVIETDPPRREIDRSSLLHPGGGGLAGVPIAQPSASGPAHDHRPATPGVRGRPPVARETAPWDALCGGKPDRQRDAAGE